MDINNYKTTRIWEQTLNTLRQLHGLTGESIVVLLDRLAVQELERIQQEQKEGRSMSQLDRVQQGLKEVGAGWWAGPYKTGKGQGKYYIHPDKYNPVQENLKGFRSLAALEQWIEQERSK